MLSALLLLAPGCTHLVFARYAERQVPVEVQGLDEAQVGPGGRLHLWYRNDAGARRASVDLPSGRAWPEGRVPIARSPQALADGRLAVAHTERAIILGIAGDPRTVFVDPERRWARSPVPWLLLPLTLAIDLSLAPISLPLTLLAMNFHT